MPSTFDVQVPSGISREKSGVRLGRGMDDPPHLMGLEGVEEPRNVVELSLDGRDAGTRREG